MNYLVHDIAPHPPTRRVLPLERSAALPPEPAALRAPIPVRAPRRSLSRVLAALSVRRRWGGPSGPGGRGSADSGVSPLAGGSTRGVAFLVNR